VRQKIRSVAILKCVGASTAQVLATYVLQVAFLALAGSLIGVGLAGVALRAIPASLLESFGGVPSGLTASAVVQGLTVGLLVSVLFALVPLLEVRRIKPLLLIRGAETGISGRFDWIQAAVGVGVGLALALVASWQAASWKAGAAVSIGFLAVAGVLYAAAFVLIRSVSPLALTPWFPLRHAVVSLRRPGNQTRVILLSVGLGSFFVLGVRALQDNLIAEFAAGMDRGGADLFLIDVQRDQAGAIGALLRDRGTPTVRMVPVLRARVTGVRGRELDLENFSDVRGRGSLAREYTITYRDNLESNEQIVDGRFWTAAEGQPPAPTGEVSIEESIHQRFKINVGDDMRFDVLGRTVNARVTSVRHVEWGDARSGGFMFVFRPGLFDHAPHTFVGFVKGPDDVNERARLQYDLVSRYPNVSVIDAREIISRIQTIVDNVVLGVSVVGGVALLSGVLILIGAVAMTKFQRVYEAAILRTLGAGTRLLTTTLALEYCALGLLAGLIGAAGALALSWAVTRHVLDMPWRPAPGVLAIGAVLTTMLVGTIGVLASADVLRKKPLGTLRAE
jgi:putative ABC transport system permease protein